MSNTDRLNEFFAGITERISPKPGDEDALAESGLTPSDLRHLRLEAQNIGHRGRKEEAIRENMDMFPVRHYQRINALIDTPGAYSHNNGEFAPMLNRLSRIRDKQREARSAKDLSQD